MYPNQSQYYTSRPYNQSPYAFTEEPPSHDSSRGMINRSQYSIVPPQPKEVITQNQILQLIDANDQSGSDEEEEFQFDETPLTDSEEEEHLHDQTQVSSQMQPVMGL